jgi:glucokinase
MPAPRCIAIDLGGTQVRVALLEGTRIIRRASAKTAITGGPLAVLSQFETLIDQVCDGKDPKSNTGIAICSAGPLDSEAGVILGIPTIPGWENFPISSVMSERSGLPVFLENDAIAAAYGEWRHGAGRGFKHMAYLTVSTGIGGGFVVDGRLLRGTKGMAGHVGHMRLSQDGPKCSCGASGCFEALASGSALEARARAASHTRPSGFLALAAQAGGVSAKQVFDGARAGDPQCLSLVKAQARYLGQGITAMIHLFSPQRVVIGGGLSQAFDLLEAGIHAVIRADAMVPFKDVRVVRAELGDNCGLIGATALMLGHLAT